MFAKIDLMKHINILFLVLLVIITTSCNDEIDQLNSNEDGILCVKDINEFKETLDKIQEMNTDELLKWEKDNGYISNELVAESIYNHMDISSFKNYEQVKEFVKENEDYFQLIEEENGEYILETKNFDKPFKYILNKDDMFQIGNKVFKAFSNCLVSIDETYIENLRKADYEIAISLDVATVNKSLLKSSSNCGDSDWKDVKSGNERITQEFGIDVIEGNDAWIVGGWHRATAYHKIWPFWFKVARDIDVSINHVIYAYEMGSLEVKQFNQTFTRSRNTSVLEGYCGSWLTINKPCGEITATFASYNTWSKQSGTIKAEAICQ